MLLRDQCCEISDGLDAERTCQLTSNTLHYMQDSKEKNTQAVQDYDE